MPPPDGRSTGRQRPRDRREPRRGLRRVLRRLSRVQRVGRAGPASPRGPGPRPRHDHGSPHVHGLPHARGLLLRRRLRDQGVRPEARRGLLPGLCGLSVREDRPIRRRGAVPRGDTPGRSDLACGQRVGLAHGAGPQMAVLQLRSQGTRGFGIVSCLQPRATASMTRAGAHTRIAPSPGSAESITPWDSVFPAAGRPWVVPRVQSDSPRDRSPIRTDHIPTRRSWDRLQRRPCATRTGWHPTP